MTGAGGVQYHAEKAEGQFKPSPRMSIKTFMYSPVAYVHNFAAGLLCPP
jgi:hypothetical protein